TWTKAVPFGFILPLRASGDLRDRAGLHRLRKRKTFIVHFFDIRNRAEAGNNVASNIATFPTARRTVSRAAVALNNAEQGRRPALQASRKAATTTPERLQILRIIFAALPPKFATGMCHGIISNILAVRARLRALGPGGRQS